MSINFNSIKGVQEQPPKNNQTTRTAQQNSVQNFNFADAIRKRFGKTPEQIATGLKKMEEYSKTLRAKRDNIASTEKASNGMTYNEASMIVLNTRSNMPVYNEKTGGVRYSTKDEALETLKNQAKNFPETQEIYNRYKQAYDAMKELEQKFPELRPNENGKLVER